MLEVNEVVVEGSSINACVSIIGIEPFEREIMVLFSTFNQDQQGTIYSANTYLVTI